METRHKQDEFYRDFKNNATPDDIRRIDENLGGMNKGPISALWDDIQILYKLIKDPNRGWGSKVAIVAALIYLISPIDAIPDVIPLLGLTDDAAVIAFTINQFRGDIEEYKATHNIE